MSDKWNECMQIKCERFVCLIFKWQRQRQRQPQQPPKTTTTTTMTTPQIATWILHLHFLHLKCHNDIMMTVFGVFHFLLLLFSRWHLYSSPFHFLCKLNSLVNYQTTNKFNNINRSSTSSSSSSSVNIDIDTVIINTYL